MPTAAVCGDVNINWPAFLGVVAAAYVIPGPDFAVIVRAATQQRRAGVAAAAGAQSGLLVHMAAAAVGLSLLLAKAPAALVGIQLAGAVYLVYLGVRTLLASRRRPSADLAERAHDRPEKERSLLRWWTQGLMTNLLNPKAILFFASLLPQFLDHSWPLIPQIVVLGLADIALGMLWWTALAFGASRIAGRLASPTAKRGWDRLTGGVFVGLGVAIAALRA